MDRQWPEPPHTWDEALLDFPSEFDAEQVLLRTIAGMSSSDWAQNRDEAPYLITIRWNNSGKESVVELAVEKEVHLPLLDELAKMTGRRWLNYPASRHELSRELASRSDNAIHLKFDRRFWVSGQTLPPGQYSVVPLDRNAESSDLFFLKERDAADGVVAGVVPVVVEPADRPRAAPAFEYWQDSDPAMIREIRLADRTIIFPSGFERLAPGFAYAFGGNPVVEFSISSRRTYGLVSVMVQDRSRGNHPLVFRVRHLHFASRCEGTLRLTSKRIVYQPGDPKWSRKHAFSLPIFPGPGEDRGDKPVKIVRDGSWRFKVVAPKNKYRFEMSFGSNLDFPGKASTETIPKVAYPFDGDYRFLKRETGEPARQMRELLMFAFRNFEVVDRALGAILPPGETLPAPEDEQSGNP